MAKIMEMIAMEQKDSAETDALKRGVDLKPLDGQWQEIGEPICHGSVQGTDKSLDKKI